VYLGLFLEVLALWLSTRVVAALTTRPWRKQPRDLSLAPLTPQVEVKAALGNTVPTSREEDS